MKDSLKHYSVNCEQIVFMVKLFDTYLKYLLNNQLLKIILSKRMMIFK